MGELSVAYSSKWDMAVSQGHTGGCIPGQVGTGWAVEAAHVWQWIRVM